MNNKVYHITNYQSQHLSRFVESYKIYHFHNNIPVKLDPTGHFELIFQLRGKFIHKTYSSPDWEVRPNYFIGGLHSKSYFVKSLNKGSKLISVRLKPNCSKYFIPDKLNLYKNKIVNLDRLFSQSKLEQLNSFTEDGLIKICLEKVEHFLMEICQQKQASPIDYACDIMIQSNGFVNVNKLAQTVCISNSQFRKRFNEEIGMSPKEYSKIVRFNFISELLMRNSNIKLTELTFKLGYFDQSHFIKDFRSVAGISPKNYIQQINQQ